MAMPPVINIMIKKSVRSALAVISIQLVKPVIPNLDRTGDLECQVVRRCSTHHPLGTIELAVWQNGASQHSTTES
jgi:hypothetical protein